VNATPQLQLNRPGGWFAAGQEVRQAALLLSDPAFKLFMWICLDADRSAGAIHAGVADLAAALAKSQEQIVDLLHELTETGVCRWQGHGALEIQDRFWPYRRVRSAAIPESSMYIAAVKRMLSGHACVQCAFTTADEKLAAEWYRSGIPVVQVERAILLGTLRKYVALLNRGGGSPITTLHYFKSLLHETQTIGSSADYWRYLSRRLDDLEQRWQHGQAWRQHSGNPETK
jgi:hypothetical protein